VATGVAKPKQSAAAMPPMGGAKLDATQVRAVAAYIASLNAKKE
jgi:mono/diheme cytochrome c family protein